MTTQVNTFEKNIKSAKIGTLKTDRLTIGRGWIPYTPTMAGGSIGAGGSSRWKYKIEGTTLRIKGGVTCISGNTSSTYTFTLPTGCESVAISLAETAAGSAVVTGSTVMGIGAVIQASTTAFAVYYQDSATTINQWGNTSNANIKADAAAPGVTMVCELTVELSPTCAALAGNLVP